jgi:hypothetical protein
MLFGIFFLAKIFLCLFNDLVNFSEKLKEFTLVRSRLEIIWMDSKAFRLMCWMRWIDIIFKLHNSKIQWIQSQLDVQIDSQLDVQLDILLVVQLDIQLKIYWNSKSNDLTFNLIANLTFNLIANLKFNLIANLTFTWLSTWHLLDCQLDTQLDVQLHWNPKPKSNDLTVNLTAKLTFNLTLNWKLIEIQLSALKLLLFNPKSIKTHFKKLFSLWKFSNYPF